MNTVFKGIVAGLVATVVLSVLMVMDIIKMLAGMMGGAVALGWVAHFMVGAGYGVAFSLFHGSLPSGNAIGKGIVLGVIGWLVMMVMLMPMMGAGFFGLSFGLMAPIATLMLHVIFGAVLDLWEREPEAALADARILVGLLQLKVKADRLLRQGWGKWQGIDLFPGLCIASPAWKTALPNFGKTRKRGGITACRWPPTCWGICAWCVHGAAWITHAGTARRKCWQVGMRPTCG